MKKELAREPKTLFLCSTYQVGKENAVEAVVRAAGGKAHVTKDRARLLRMSERWDDALHTEVDSDDVRVRVTSMAGETTHEDLAEKLEEFNARGGTDANGASSSAPHSTTRFNSVVAFRPTGWTATNAMKQPGVVDDPVALCGVYVGQTWGGRGVGGGPTTHPPPTRAPAPPGTNLGPTR